MAGMVQVVLLVDPETKSGLDQLRIVLGKSRASVGRDVLAAAVKAALEQEAERVARLAVVASGYGKTLAEFAEQYAKENSAKTYGPKLEELEEKAGRAKARRDQRAKAATPAATAG